MMCSDIDRLGIRENASMYERISAKMYVFQVNKVLPLCLLEKYGRSLYQFRETLLLYGSIHCIVQLR